MGLDFHQGWEFMRLIVLPLPTAPISVTVLPVIALKILRSCLKYVDSSFCFFTESRDNSGTDQPRIGGTFF